MLNIPSYLKYDSTSLTPSFRSNDIVLQKDMAVRIKLISCRMEASTIITLGSIQDDFLGVVAP
ncbi:DNA-directed RNA polymerase II subunit [Entomophthora muscae]|nr:DNA-directed RNA polymerase II subunit [Entomophthora muscae]